MTDTRPTATREERLAARLRDNLKRRKAQARALDGMEGRDGESQPDSADRQESSLSKSAG
ncbi:MAG: hypothetical protein C0409_07510 [Novosphingobium sp.]|nr:hypothetical protein [Novosphingobium sp.]